MPDDLPRPATDGTDAPRMPRGRMRMYRQGLGDCIYLEFSRAEGAQPFRIMVDCGLVLGASDGAAKITRVMDHLADELQGSPIDILVVTHPHWDHVSGFVDAKDSFAKITPLAVWMAWTENPKDDLAKDLKSSFATAESSLRMAVGALGEMGMADEARRTEGLLEFLGEAGSKIKPGGRARTTQQAMRNAAGRVAQPKYCLPNEAPIPIPGTKAQIFVLGPPRDVDKLRKMAPSSRAPETYSQTTLSGTVHLAGAFENHLDSDGGADSARPFDSNFIIPLEESQIRSGKSAAEKFLSRSYFSQDEDWRRIDGDWMQGTTHLALLLDRAVNNSSLALAIELEPCGDVILLAADAQVGNWLSWLELNWQLDGRTVTGPDLIARTIAYKVGHHASLNATLRADGVEKMGRLRYSFVPVDAEQARAKGWGNNIPFASLLEALTRGGLGVVLRSDMYCETGNRDITVDDIFHEVVLW